MKLSLNWLKDYISIDISIEELCHKLTMAGLEVEKCEKIGNDYVIEMEITPNRPDCLNVIGIAREVGAILNKKVRFPKISEHSFPQLKCDISIEDYEGCPCYIGTVLEGIKVSQSPDKIIQRIQSIGMRPVNNIVDITNFCLMETGQPMHAFDYDKLDGGKIIVRRAKKGEKIVTIDEVERELDPSILVIADAKKPVAIAGIMGGKETEVTNNTKKILIESAYFNSILIRRASRKLALTSDASYRFERGVDYSMVGKSANRTIDFVLEFSGGKIIKHVKVELKKKKDFKEPITISLDEINNAIGTSFTSIKCKNILEKLEFDVSGTKSFRIKAPFFRNDVKRKVDIIEEIARVSGYDTLPLTVPRVVMSDITVSDSWMKRNKIRDLLCAQGLNEIITYTMISKDFLKKSKREDIPFIKVINPLSQDQEIMRPVILPSMLNIVASNINRGQKNINIFETGKEYFKQGEKEVLGIILNGIINDNWKDLSKANVDFYDLKGIIEKVLTSFGFEKNSILTKYNDRVFFDGAHRASFWIDDKEVAFFGKLEEDVLSNFGIKKKDIYFGEMDLDFIFKHKKEYKKFTPIPEFPSIIRDVSFAVRKEITSKMVEEEIRKYAPAPSKGFSLSSIKFVEKYEGEKIQKDMRGLVFSLEYRSSTKTLRDEDVEAAHEKICNAIVQSLQVVKR